MDPWESINPHAGSPSSPEAAEAAQLDKFLTIRSELNASSFMDPGASSPQTGSLDIILKATKDSNDFYTRAFTLTTERPFMKLGRRTRRLGEAEAVRPDNGIFAAPPVSRDHASLYLKNDPLGIEIVDIYSLHGTKVNGTAIQPEVPKVLCSGDIVTLGIHIHDTNDPPVEFTIYFVSSAKARPWPARAFAPRYPSLVTAKANVEKPLLETQAPFPQGIDEWIKNRVTPWRQIQGRRPTVLDSTAFQESPTSKAPSWMHETAGESASQAGFAVRVPSAHSSDDESGERSVKSEDGDEDIDTFLNHESISASSASAFSAHSDFSGSEDEEDEYGDEDSYGITSGSTADEPGHLSLPRITSRSASSVRDDHGDLEPGITEGSSDHESDDFESDFSGEADGESCKSPASYDHVSCSGYAPASPDLAPTALEAASQVAPQQSTNFSGTDVSQSTILQQENYKHPTCPSLGFFLSPTQTIQSLPEDELERNEWSSVSRPVDSVYNNGPLREQSAASAFESAAPEILNEDADHKVVDATNKSAAQQRLSISNLLNSTPPVDSVQSTKKRKADEISSSDGLSEAQDAGTTSKDGPTEEMQAAMIPPETSAAKVEQISKTITTPQRVRFMLPGDGGERPSKRVKMDHRVNSRTSATKRYLKKFGNAVAGGVVGGVVGFSAVIGILALAGIDG